MNDDVARDAVPSPGVARRFTAACLLGAIPALVVFIWLVNGGRMDFFQRPLFTGNFYDLQARSLLHGHWDVPSAAFYIEGFVRNGKTYTYFGPFPSVLRMPILLVTNRLDGRLTQVSMLLAFTVALFGASRLLWRARERLRAGAPFNTGEWLGTAGWVFFVGVGSALLFPGSRPIVYHEAELWGAALALVGLDAVIGVALWPSRRRVAISAVLATLAILSRPSVGLGPAAALGVLAIAALVARPRPDIATSSARLAARVRAALPIGAAAALPLVAYAVVNMARFGSLFGNPWNRQVFAVFNTKRQAALSANGGSLSNARAVATTLVQYLRPDALRGWHLFPFLDFPTRRADVFLGVRFDTLDPSSSLLATMPAFCLLALGVGAAILWRRVDRAAIRAFVPAILGALVAVLPTLTLVYITNRWLTDFLPLVLVPASVGAQLVFRRLLAPGIGHRRFAVVTIVLVGLFVFGAWANVALAMNYQRLTGWSGLSPAVRRGFIGFQESVADALGTTGYPVERVPRLPRRSTPHQLAVVGQCEALYWGDDNFGWQPVEIGAAGVRARARVWFRPKPASGPPISLLSVGSDSRAYLLTVRVVRADVVVFETVDQTGRSPTGVLGIGGSTSSSPVRLPRGGSVVVDATLDRQLRTTTVSVDGRRVLHAEGQVIPAGRASITTRWPGGDTFVERARSLPVRTPLCHRVTMSH